jgi:hypothetical protein
MNGTSVKLSVVPEAEVRVKRMTCVVEIVQEREIDGFWGTAVAVASDAAPESFVATATYLKSYFSIYSTVSSFSSRECREPDFLEYPRLQVQDAYAPSSWDVDRGAEAAPRLDPYSYSAPAVEVCHAER